MTPKTPAGESVHPQALSFGKAERRQRIESKRGQSLPRRQSLPQRHSCAVAPRARVADRDGDSLLLACPHRGRCSCPKRVGPPPCTPNCEQLLEKGTVLTSAALLRGGTARSDRGSRWGQSFSRLLSPGPMQLPEKGQLSPLRPESRTDPEGDRDGDSAFWNRGRGS